jgi:hypothetical protein
MTTCAYQDQSLELRMMVVAHFLYVRLCCGMICPNCRLLPQFKKYKNVSNTKRKNTSDKTKQVNQAALALNSICVCNSKPEPSDKLLECHSDDCRNGKFFTSVCLTTVKLHGCAMTVRQRSLPELI